MEYIIDCTELLNLTTTQRDTFDFVRKQLSIVKKLDHSIVDIAVVAGFILDTLLNRQPNDVDIKYAINDSNGNLVIGCKCDYVKSLINNTELKSYKLDLGSITENNNTKLLSINEKHIGIFSHYPEYISQFRLDEQGRIWGNVDSLKDFFNKEYNPRMEGIAAWIAFEGKTYHAALAILLIRGLGYIRKRDLKIGDRFKYFLCKSKDIFDTFSGEDHNHKGLVKYFYKQVNSIDDFKELLQKHNLEKIDSIVDPFIRWVERYSD